MSGGTPTTQQTISKTELPAWVDAAGQGNYNKAVELDHTPLQQYAGSTVAPLSQGTKDAFSYFNANKNAGVADTAAAGGLFSGVGNSTAVDNIDTYLNPYIDNVETKALDALDRNRSLALGSNADKAVAAKAFGGSRGAIVDAVTNAESLREAGLLSAGLRKSGFDTALSASQGDRATKLAAGSGLLNTGAQKQGQVLENFKGMTGIGATEQAQAQNEIDAQVAKFNEQRGKEEADLNRRLAALGMTPYSSSTTSNTTGQQGSAGTDWAMAGLGALSLFAGLSEDTEKTDVKKLGKIGDSPLNLYAYRYKGDPKSYPKVVGAMASEVEEHYPDRVAKVGGKRVIDYGLFSELV